MNIYKIYFINWFFMTIVLLVRRINTSLPRKKREKKDQCCWEFSKIDKRSRFSKVWCICRTPDTMTFVVDIWCEILFSFSQNRSLLRCANDRAHACTYARMHAHVSRRLRISVRPHVAGDGWGALSPARNQLRLDELCVSRNASRSYRLINNKPRTALHVARDVRRRVAGCSSCPLLTHP